MTLDEFWNLLEGLPRGVAERELERRLDKLSPEDLAGFGLHFTQQFFRAYDWMLWNAAYIIGGGCSDDSFMDFRYGLISLGRTVFEAALADPDSLADVIAENEDIRNQLFASVANHVYERKTGSEMPETGLSCPGNPSGEDWDPDNKELCAKHLPRLWAKFGS